MPRKVGTDPLGPTERVAPDFASGPFHQVGYPVGFATGVVEDRAIGWVLTGRDVEPPRSEEEISPPSRIADGVRKMMNPTQDSWVFHLSIARERELAAISLAWPDPLHHHLADSIGEAPRPHAIKNHVCDRTEAFFWFGNCAFPKKSGGKRGQLRPVLFPAFVREQGIEHDQYRGADGENGGEYHSRHDFESAGYDNLPCSTTFYYIILYIYCQISVMYHELGTMSLDKRLEWGRIAKEIELSSFV